MKRPDITPGPWIKNEFSPISTGRGNIRYIAQICPHGARDAENDEDRANAQAIAALPDLLDALEAAAIHSHAMTLDGYTITQRKDLARSTNEKIKAALVKAGYTF